MRIAPSDVVVDGFSFAQVTPSGAYVMIEALDGWKGSPAASFDAVKRAAMPGSLANKGQLNARILAGMGQIIAPGPAALEDAEDLINAAISESPVRVEVTEASGRRRWCMAQRQDEVLIRATSDRHAVFSWQMFAEDPLKYGDLLTGSTGLPTFSGGLSWPMSWPVQWTGVSNSGVVHIDNPGKVRSAVILRFESVAGPRVLHVGSGRELALSSSYQVGAGSWLTMDGGDKSVRENDQASRSTFMVERGWFSLDPGPNDFLFSNTGPYDPAARMTVTAYPAWR